MNKEIPSLAWVKVLIAGMIAAIALIDRAKASDVDEQSFFSSYTEKELQVMAMNAKDSARKPRKAITEQDIIDMAELRGYVAGLLDSSKPNSRLNICAKKHGVNIITNRFAIVLSAHGKQDVSGALLSLVSIMNACNDDLWK